MSEQERLGRLDDQQEAEEQPSKTDGPSSAGEYDPAEGSPGRSHPTAREGAEAVTRDDTGESEEDASGSGAGDGGTGS